MRRHVAGAERMSLATEGESSSGEVTDHPAVQAAVAQFQGEVVAVRPRAPGKEKASEGSSATS